jgi:hypothetical protein
MKAKHNGIVCLMLVLFVGLAMMGDWLSESWKRNLRLSPPPPQEPADHTVPPAATLSEMARLTKRMGRLLQPGRADETPVHLSLLGYRPLVTPSRDLHASGQVVPTTDFSHQLTFTLVTGQTRLCVVDGLLYKEGAKLPDGGRIVKVKAKGVLIEKYKVRKWFRLGDKNQQASGA